MTVTLPAGDFDTHAGSDPHPSLYNEDLAPLPEEKRRWGAFEFFNVWTNDVQSLAGYTLAASLFITAGINGWWVFAAIILAGFFVNFLVNLTGKPSVKYGIPYAVMARSSMGVRGAQFPALIRGIVAIFWYGAQTYFASTAVALAINAIIVHASRSDLHGHDVGRLGVVRVRRRAAGRALPQGHRVDREVPQLRRSRRLRGDDRASRGDLGAGG